MYSFRNDPDVDGVGIAFFDAVGERGERLDLSLESLDGWRSCGWAVAEREVNRPIFSARQVHGHHVLVVALGDSPREVATYEADALVTQSPGIAVAVRAADCLPVLLADPAAGVVAAAHAGRVGLARGVLAATVARLQGLGATHVRAWIGPHVCGACYEVPAELQSDYCAALPAARAETSWGTPSLDLGVAAEAQLSALGCVVTRVDPCTMETSTLHSYRRDGARSGRQAGVVWLG